MQDEALFGYFTAEEALEFSAKLRISENVSDRVNEILKTLSLDHCRNTRIN